MVKLISCAHDYLLPNQEHIFNIRMLTLFAGTSCPGCRQLPTCRGSTLKESDKRSIQKEPRPNRVNSHHLVCGTASKLRRKIDVFRFFASPTPKGTQFVPRVLSKKEIFAAEFLSQSPVRHRSWSSTSSEDQGKSTSVLGLMCNVVLF